MASTLARLKSSGFLPVGTPKFLMPCVYSSCWQRKGTSPSHCGCLSDSLHLPRHLWTDEAVHDDMCRGVHWISWKTFWTLVIRGARRKYEDSISVRLRPPLFKPFRINQPSYRSTVQRHIVQILVASSNKLQKYLRNSEKTNGQDRMISSRDANLRLPEYEAGLCLTAEVFRMILSLFNAVLPTEWVTYRRYIVIILSDELERVWKGSTVIHRRICLQSIAKSGKISLGITGLRVEIWIPGETGVLVTTPQHLVNRHLSYSQYSNRAGIREECGRNLFQYV
jgi:hypothetical protein